MIKKSQIILAIVVLILVGVFLGKTEKKEPIPLVTNFEECVNAGNPIMESYPRQCRHGDKTFVEIIEGTNLPPPSSDEGEGKPVIVDDGDKEVISGYISGHVTIGPNCPVEQEGKPCPTPPEAYSSRSVFVYEKDGVTVKYIGKINAVGEYSITIDPGNYFIQIKPAGIGEGEKKPIKVISSKTTIVNFDIDTGIR